VIRLNRTHGEVAAIRDAGQDEYGRHPGPVAHLDVGFESIPDHETRRWIDAEALGSGGHDGVRRFPHQAIGPAIGDPLDGPDHSGRVRDLAVRDRTGPIGVRRDERRLVVDRRGRIREGCVIEVPVHRGNDHRRRFGIVGDVHIGRSELVAERLLADDVGDTPRMASAEIVGRHGRGRDDVGRFTGDPESVELLAVAVPTFDRLVRDEQNVRPVCTKRRDGVIRFREEFVAAVDGPIEVENRPTEAHRFTT